MSVIVSLGALLRTHMVRGDCGEQLCPSGLRLNALNKQQTNEINFRERALIR